MKSVSVSAVWSVPSTEKPGQYYRVELFDNGATACDCPWGRKEEALLASSGAQRRLSKCWHAKLVIALECDYVRGYLPGQYEAACSGDVLAVARILSGFGDELVQAGALHNASRCYEVVAKYMQAVSTQGAALDITEEVASATSAPAMAA
jgi:hypothetical protein